MACFALARRDCSPFVAIPDAEHKTWQSLWKDFQSLWKENPNHEEEKSKP